MHRVLAATYLAGGAADASRPGTRFSGSRVGRGSGVGKLLASRDRYAAFRARRVIVKASIVRLAGKGAAAAAAHLRYIQRDGTTRDGERGALYGPDDDVVDAKSFLGRGAGDRHQFRFIVSAEDGDQYDDLKPLMRRLMTRVEQDLGTRLDWVAVDHFNTGHPHSHVIVRGADDRGQDLVIARDYLTAGIRERAAELVDLDLGPRDDRAVETKLRAEIEQERFTGIDRRLLSTADDRGVLRSSASSPFEQALRAGRLAKLSQMGLAHQIDRGRWAVSDKLEATLRRMGERGDIVRTMQRAYASRGQTLAAADRVIFDPGDDRAAPLTGRVVERGLSDESRDRHYLLIEATDGRTHYVDIGRGDAVEPLATGAIVRIAPATFAPRKSDRLVAEIAFANGGSYDIDTHLAHDPSASQDFAEAHVRRLEALRRRGSIVTRNDDGSWTIAPDHLERVAQAERDAVSTRPVRLNILSSKSVEEIAVAEGPTWLDRQLTDSDPVPLRDAGFGRAAGDAIARRRRWLVEQGLAHEAGDSFVAGPRMIEALRRRALLRLSRRLAKDLGLRYVDKGIGDRIEGLLARSVEVGDDRYGVVVRAKEFSLVPWRPVLERHIGKEIGGTWRERDVNWSLTRSRGPSVS